MIENEALREALLELDALRKREAEALRESNALLAGLERMNAAASASGALSALLASVRDTMECDTVCLMEASGPDVAVAEADGERAVSAVTAAAHVLLSKPRRVVDVALVDWWAPVRTRGATPVRSWLSVPFAIGEERLALVCMAQEPGRFSPSDLRLLSRLAGLASQAMATRTLAERHALLAAVIEKAAVAVSIADASDEKRPLIYVNKAFEQMTGFDAADVLGSNCRFLSAEDADSPERVRVREAVARREGGRFTLKNRRRNGEIFWNDFTLYPVNDETGAVRYLVGTQVDASPRRAAEEERDVARERLVTAVSHIPEGLILLDPADRIVFANGPYRDVFAAPDPGWAPGRPFVDVVADALAADGFAPGEALARARDRLAAMRSGSNEFETTLADGRVISVKDRLTGDGGCVSVAADVTALKTNEKLLAMRVAAMDVAQDGIAITDQAGCLVYANPAFRAMFDIADDDPLAGRRWSALYQGEKAGWIAERAMPALRSTGSWRGEVILDKHGGSSIDQEIALTLLEGLGMICIARDVSHRRRGETERARLIGQLSAAQRQEAIGVIAAGIAHDLNNIVSVVTGSASLIASSPATGPAEQRHAVRIGQAASSMADLIHRLLDFAKRTPQKIDVDLGSVVEEATDLVRISVEKNVALSTRTPEEPLVVPGDPTNILQIILNLAINARDAIGPCNGRIALSASRFDATDELDAEAGEIVAGQLRQGWTYGVVAVADTGSGIDPSLFRRIVEPYYSTKGDAGTGLGLSVVAGIVQSMRGFLTIASAPGEGTRIAVYLPTTDVEPSSDADAKEAALADEIDLSGRLILLVDDDEGELETIETLLGRAGAEVASCQHPYDAVHTVQDDPEAWDLVITDFEMPDMSGAGLAFKLREINEELPIILYTARVDWRSQARPGDHELFSREVIKPAAPGALVRAVAGLLMPAEKGDAREA